LFLAKLSASDPARKNQGPRVFFELQ
jgi:hypothetical protein